MLVSKKSSPYPRWSRFSLCYLAEILCLCYLCFRSAIHFELIFVEDIRSVCRFFSSFFLFFSFFFFFCIWISSCSSTICWKDYPCSMVLSFRLCQRSIDYTSVTSVFSILSHGSICLFFHQYYTVSITVAFIVSLKFRDVSPSTLFFSFNILLAMLNVFSLLINFTISLLICTK